jgi:hypothetical protein
MMSGKRWRPIFLLLLALGIGGAVTPSDYREALRSLVEAERAFSATSVEKGMRDAFLAYLADDGVLFRPLPVNGKQLWEPRPASLATLIWEPSFAAVSLAGDMGYTTGPWELRPAPGQVGEIGHGHFISVWQRAPGAPWRLAVDIGISHAKPRRGLGKVSLVEGQEPKVVPDGGTTRADDDDPRRLDETFAREGANGLGVGLARVGASDVRINLEGKAPFVGLVRARAALDTIRGVPTFAPMGSGVADSRDLAYTYGVLERRQGDTVDSTVYVNIWRRRHGKAGWELALAVFNPVTR